MKLVLAICSVVLVAAFPLLLPGALTWLGLPATALLLIVLAGLRLLSLGGLARDQNRAPLLPAALLLLLAVAAWGSGDTRWFRFYPVAVNALMLGLFAASLWIGQPLAERLARLREPDLPPSGIAYTRRVTQLWCVFFIVNGSIALWTAIAASLQTWSLYNGCIAYLLMGTLFALEFIVRQRVRRGHHA